MTLDTGQAPGLRVGWGWDFRCLLQKRSGGNDEFPTALRRRSAWTSVRCCLDPRSSGPTQSGNRYVPRNLRGCTTGRRELTGSLLQSLAIRAFLQDYQRVDRYGAMRLHDHGIHVDF